MDENKEKLSGAGSENNEDIHDEMEELAKIFKEELDKAKKESESFADGLENIQVEGYNPQKVSLGEKKAPISEESLCEYCGEKIRGTEKNPDSPYCEDCEATLEKYPYDYRGIICAIITVCLTVAAVFCFAINVPVFSSMKQGDKALSEGRLHTAINKYDSAEEFAQTIDGKKGYFNIHAKRVETNYKMVNMNSAITEIDENIPEILFKLPAFHKLNVILEDSEKMQASALVAQKHLSKYSDVTEKNYDAIVSELESLVGKKIYIKGTEYFDETEKDFTPDGTETVYICDEGWVRMYQYAAAQQVGKDQKTILGYLQKCADSSEYMWTLVAPLLASTYAGTGEYDKAEELIDRYKKVNAESAEWYMVKSLLYRYRDKDYAAAQQVCDKGLKMLSGLPNGESFIMQYGYMLQIQQALNSIMQDDIESAYKTIGEAYDSTSLTGGLTIQIRDLYAILAYATEDTEAFKALELEIDSYGDDSIAFTSDVTDFKEGKLTLKQIAESGRYDLI